LRNNIYIGNLTPVDDHELEHLEHLVAPFGIVLHAAMDGSNAATPGTRFGVVKMQTEIEAETTVKTLNGFRFRGRALTVRWATVAEQTACGHPPMFGSMNMSTSEGGERGAPAGRLGSTTLESGMDSGGAK
jgi:RNA recognition motif-containing protein